MFKCLSLAVLMLTAAATKLQDKVLAQARQEPEDDKSQILAQVAQEDDLEIVTVTSHLVAFTNPEGRYLSAWGGMRLYSGRDQEETF